MFERLCTLLLRLYPAGFRRTYGRDALQLIQDRAHHERGALRRARLLMDLAADLLATSLTWRPDAAAAVARVDSGPRFDFIEGHRPRPEALAAGTLVSMLMLASFALLFQPRIFPPAPAQLGEGSGGEPADLESSGSDSQVVAGNGSDTRQWLVATVAGILKQFYVDRAIGRQLGDALLAFEKNGQYNRIATGPELVERLNADIHTTALALGIPPGAFVADVVYSAQPLPDGPPPPTTAASRERDRIRILELNCRFERIETLPRNIGYVKLNGFPPAWACLETATRAMASVNGSAALIIDVRDNGGGMGELALHMAGYLFERPVFLFDPRPNSPVPTHTASPIGGSKLTTTPVYLLTSARTASAAEYFVYNLKMLKRVTVVGERTAGAMHAGAVHRIDDHYFVGIQETPPPENPYPIKGWEVIGVDPHVAVPAGDAFEVARVLAESRTRLK